jgi:hypothetical protein
MFLIEIGAGVAAGSASLQADALDFLGDAANYAISLLVVGMVLRYRAMAALAKGTTMGLFGLWIIGTAIWHTLHGTLPSAYTWAQSSLRLSRPRTIVWSALGVSRRRCQYALRMDLHPK